MRLFIGLPLPPAYQEGLARLRQAMAPLLASRLAWTRPGNWHLTLKFLGEVDDVQLPAVATALAGLAWEPFALRAGGAGAFPNDQRPRVLWLGLTQGAEACARLAAAVEGSLTPLGFSPETREFRPHLTIARVQDAKRDSWGEALDVARAAHWPDLVMERLVLWQSVLGPHGPRYTVRHETRSNAGGEGREGEKKVGGPSHPWSGPPGEMG